MQQHGRYRNQFAQPIDTSAIRQPTPLAQPILTALHASQAATWKEKPSCLKNDPLLLFQVVNHLDERGPGHSAERHRTESRVTISSLHETAKTAFETADEAMSDMPSQNRQTFAF